MSREWARGWFAPLMVVAVCVQAATFATRPMVSYRAIEIGAGNLGIGLITAGFAVLPLFLAVAVGRWVDASGERAAAVLGAVLIAGSAATLTVARSLWALVLLNALFGLGHLCSVVAQQAIIANRVSVHGHDRAYGLFTVFTSLGQLIGPPAAALVASGGTGDGTTRALMVGAAFGVAAGVGTLRVASGNAPRRPDTDGRAPLLGTLHRPGMWQAMVTSMATVSTVDLVVAYLPAWGQEQGIGVVAVGWLLALRACATLTSRLAMERLIIRYGRRPVLVASTVTAAVTLAAFPFCGLAASVPVVAVMGFALGIGQPLTLSWVAGRARPGERGTALALRLTGNRLGQVVVPGAAGAVAGVTSVLGVFGLSAAMLTVTAALAARAPMGTED
ncbi:MFS transporter [Spongiactinospora gelatinilytica]|uniref:MFS transporter n=1 Tax=Spongiactinospora gelatinilytica TaxID=2666298 RepID=A0A2W2GPE7_9ACTN|nr:MFS transporter [Spongiactinospora gelatinilytica]PZG49742.1 MFS transporter [Spongiactinospora gelatinilytica]